VAKTPKRNGIEQQISAGHVQVGLGRFSGPVAPAQIAAFQDGRVVVVYENFSPPGSVYARFISPDGSLSPDLIVRDGASLSSVAVLPGDDFAVAMIETTSAYGRVLFHACDAMGNSLSTLITSEIAVPRLRKFVGTLQVGLRALGHRAGLWRDRDPMEPWSSRTRLLGNL